MTWPDDTCGHCLGPKTGDHPRFCIGCIAVHQEPDAGWVTKDLFDAVWRAFCMTLEGLEVIAMDGPGEVSQRQERAMAGIVARSARRMIPEYRPHDSALPDPPDSAEHRDGP